MVVGLLRESEIGGFQSVREQDIQKRNQGIELGEVGGGSGFSKKQRQ